MVLSKYQEWVKNFYKSRDWYKYNEFIRLNFLMEEVGELSQAIRKYEIGRDRPDEKETNSNEDLQAIKEELGDILDNIVIIADKYGFNLNNIIEDHVEKFESRYNKGEK